MKRILPVFLTVIAFMVCLFAMPATVSAANAPELEIDYTPTQLSSSGSVSLSITVSNNDADITNAVLSVDGKQVKDIGSLGAYETSEYSNPSYKISTQKLGTDIAVELSYSVDGTTKKATGYFNVQKGTGDDPEADDPETETGTVSLSMTASADKTTVAKNTNVTFSFAVENRGTVKAENCQIKASNLNGGKTIDSFSLDAGQSKLVTYMGEVIKDMTITPQITYTANNKNYTEKMNTITIKVTDAMLDVTITPETTSLEAGQSIGVDVTLKNTGNTNLKNITLYDNSDKKIPLTSASLDKGGSMTASTTIAPEASGDIEFYARADDDSGSTATYNSNIVTLTVAEPEAEPTPTPTPLTDYTTGLTVETEVDDAALAKNTMSFSIKITNSTGENYTNAVVSEGNLGNIETIPELRPGTTTVVYEKEYTEPASYAFKTVATAPDGTQVTAKSTPVMVGNADDKESGSSPITSIGTILIIVIILVVLIIATVVLLIIFVRKGKKKKLMEGDQRAEEGQRLVAGRAKHQSRPDTKGGGAPYLDEDDELEARMIDEMLEKKPKRAKIDMDDMEILPKDEQQEIEEPAPKHVAESTDDPEIAARPIHRTAPPTAPTPVAPEEPAEDFDDRNMF